MVKFQKHFAFCLNFILDLIIITFSLCSHLLRGPCLPLIVSARRPGAFFSCFQYIFKPPSESCTDHQVNMFQTSRSAFSPDQSIEWPRLKAAWKQIEVFQTVQSALKHGDKSANISIRGPAWHINGCYICFGHIRTPKKAFKGSVPL